MKHFIELVTFKTKVGVTPNQVISAAEEVNRFLKSQLGTSVNFKSQGVSLPFQSSIRKIPMQS
jgi:hypothetical protein